MCELLYFLEGHGSVIILNNGQLEAMLDVTAGDSVLAAAQTVCVHKQALRSAGHASVTFLRVVLPLKYVVESAHNPTIAMDCRNAAAKVLSVSGSIHVHSL